MAHPSESFVAQTSEKPVSLAEGYIDLDLNRRLIQNRAATHLFSASESGIEGITPGDILVIDRSIQPRNGYVILADIDGEYALRRLVKNQGALYLVNDTGNKSPFPVNEERGLFCGVVTHSIHSHLAG